MGSHAIPYTLERHGKDKMEITLNKLLQGAGAGTDPTEIDVPVGETFTELVGGENNIVAQDNTWEDWDLSGIIGAGATTVLLGSNSPYGAGLNVGCRNNGSALARLMAVATTGEWWGICQCDASRIIEIYGLTAGSGGRGFDVLGYWS